MSCPIAGLQQPGLLATRPDAGDEVLVCRPARTDGCASGLLDRAAVEA